MFDPFASAGSDATDVPHFRIALRLRGDTLDPEFLTQQLGVAPTFSARKGDELPGERRRARETGVWVYRPAVPPGAELGEVISMLLDPLPDDSTLWEELTGTYTADVRCGVFLEADHQGTAIDAEILQRLGRLGLPLALDFHGPASVAPDDADG